MRADIMTGAGMRRRRNRAPQLNGTGDATIIRYSALGNTVATSGTTGGSVHTRYYVPGYASIASFIGPNIVSAYSSGKFLPGTKIRWEPSVSFTTSGRLLVGFTDNPEVAATIQTLFATFQATPTTANLNPCIDAVRALGSVVSFPVWQTTDIPFPTRLRRKRFDVNENITATADILDRSMQTVMFCCVEGGPTTAQNLGGFWYHDVVDVEGVHGTIT